MRAPTWVPATSYDSGRPLLCRPEPADWRTVWARDRELAPFATGPGRQPHGVGALAPDGFEAEPRERPARGRAAPRFLDRGACGVLGVWRQVLPHDRVV